jgi:GPH family glycoside/pentoside/hexuronide:cation symporter
MIGLGFVGLWLIVPSMQADVADFDEVKSHARREGSFSSVFSWSTKVAWTIVFASSGWLLVFTGFDVDVGAIQPPEVLQRMHLFYVIIPVVFLSICAVAVYRYDLSRERVEEIRGILEQRRGKIDK